MSHTQVDAWIQRVERITKWTCPKETRHKVDVLGAKTREEESKWRGAEIRRRTPAPKVIKKEEKEERDPSVPQYGPYDVLQYHSGSKGRREFFRIQKAAHARPALSEETCLKMEDEPDLYEGACFRNFVRFASQRGLVLDPFLSRVDADKRSLDLTGMALGDSLGEAVASSLPRLPGLERLSLAGNRLSDKSMDRRSCISTKPSRRGANVLSESRFPASDNRSNPGKRGKDEATASPSPSPRAMPVRSKLLESASTLLRKGSTTRPFADANSTKFRKQAPS